jgi:hypothetical protein
MEFPFSETVVLKDELSGAVKEFTSIQARSASRAWMYFVALHYCTWRLSEVPIFPVWDHLLHMALPPDNIAELHADRTSHSP